MSNINDHYKFPFLIWIHYSLSLFRYSVNAISVTFTLIPTAISLMGPVNLSLVSSHVCRKYASIEYVYEEIKSSKIIVIWVYIWGILFPLPLKSKNMTWGVNVTFTFYENINVPILRNDYKTQTRVTCIPHIINTERRHTYHIDLRYGPHTPDINVGTNHGSAPCNIELRAVNGRNKTLFLLRGFYFRHDLSS